MRSFFDTVSQEGLIKFVEHRVGDRRIIRLIQKWLKAGVLEDGIVTVSDKGTGQGSVISPLLANLLRTCLAVKLPPSPPQVMLVGAILRFQLLTPMR
nr:hypothetical protein [Bradyrhizobium erythrophlei]